MNNGIPQYVILMNSANAAEYLLGLNNRHVPELGGFPAVISRFKPEQMVNIYSFNVFT